VGAAWAAECAAAAEAGAAAANPQAASGQHRKAQWWLDFVAAEDSTRFHAPQELARILAEVIDHARQGQLEADRASRRK
jgi:nitrite reductase (cytochrome c-552)